MEEKQSRGLVMALSLVMAAAFVAITILILTQNVNVTVRYAESISDLSITELSSSLSAFMDEQSALVSTHLIDDELVEAVELESQGASRDEVMARLQPSLEKLLVDEEASAIFLASTLTHVVYRSDGVYILPENGAVDLQWIEDISSSGSKNKMEAFHIKDRETMLNGESVVLAGRSLKKDGMPLAALGACVRPSVLEELMKEHCSEQGQDALCFDANGTILLSTNEGLPVNANAFERISALGQIADQLQPHVSEHWNVWTGLEGLMPRGQKLYEVRYNKDFDAYILMTSTGEDVFATMRTRAAVLILSLIVVMVLLLFLLMTMARWYRSQLIRAATTDELTGLANRKSFTTSYEQYAAQMHEERATLALIDVDRFKQINDGYGHAGGDHALAAIAQEIRATTAHEGLAGRWGGDEFICILRATGDEARGRLEQMIERIAALEFEEGFSASVSVGTTELVQGAALERMVEQADDALYVTKEGGRGFLTAYEPGVTPHMVPEQSGTRGVIHTNAPTQAVAPAAAREVQKDAAAQRGREALHRVAQDILYAVSKMVPFVAGGGVLIAVAFLIDGASVDLSILPAEVRANFGAITPLAAGLKEVGSAAFNFMLPIFGAFFAQSLAGEEAFMAGFAGGYLASQGSAGFVGTVSASFVAAIVVRLMKNFVDETPKAVRNMAPVLLYPLFSLLIMYLLMRVVIDPVATGFEMTMTSLLESMQGGNRVLLCALCAALMATDMGGPINKSAYHFGLASIAAGEPEIMAAVMVGGMVPPCGIAICMALFPEKFSQSQREQRASVMLMGLSFITEGAIPFLLVDVLRVIPSCVIGAAVSGGLSAFYGCELMAPHGGIFVFPVVNSPALYLMSLIAGSVLCALLLGLLKKPVERELS